jgi:heat shock protein HslJ
MKHIRTLGLVLLMEFTLSVVGCAVSEITPENEATLTPMPRVVTTRMAALYIGPLTMVDGCLRIGDGGASNLVVWPPDFEIEAFDERTRRQIPAGCPGPYWLVGSISPVEAADLVGTEWVLISLNGNSLIEETSITLYFEEAFLGGSMTCNGYGGGPDSGRYVATDDGTLTVAQPLAVTVQLCSSPTGIMEQEEAFVQALQRAAAYRVIGDRLEIDSAAGDTSLVFAREE